MKPSSFIPLLVSVVLPVLSFAADAVESAPALAGKAVRLRVTDADLSDPGRWGDLRKKMDATIAAGAATLVFDIHVAGGDAQPALARAEEVARLKVRTVVFVNSSAVAGGALLACGCDEIWMIPGSRIGLAPPTVAENEELSKQAQDTLLAQSMALLRAGVRSLCKLKGHRPEVAEAFVDKELELTLGGQKLSAKGELLLLDADQAARQVDGAPVLARGVCADLNELKQKALGGMEVLELDAAVASAEAKSSTPGSPVAAGKNPAAAASRPAKTEQGPYTGKVVRITVGEEDLINPARFEFMSRTLERCSAQGAEAVIFDLDTPGGLAWETTTLMMRDLQRYKGRTLAYVNPRALSAGAMTAVATDGIYMAPASSVGAATPVNSDHSAMGEAERAKFNSAFMSMARTVSKEKGHDPRVIEAMIDANSELVVNGQVLCGKGEILTLDASQATMLVDGKPLFAKAIVDSLDGVKIAEGLKGETVTAEPSGFERLAIWVATYASMLILIGIAGAYLEMQTPGFGLPGFISLAAFGLFFFGHYVAGSLVGQEALAAGTILILGLVLLVVEFFVLPGTFVFGIAGFICIIGALIYTMSGWEMNAPVALPTPDGGEAPPVPRDGISLLPYAMAMRNLGIGIAGAVVLILALMRYLPRVGPFRRMVLQAAVGGTVQETPVMAAAAVISAGAAGVARSALRPYGTVEIAGRMVEAVVEGDYLQCGAAVRVREVRGGRIVVEAVG